MIDNAAMLPPELMDRTRDALRGKQATSEDRDRQLIGRAFEAMLVRHMVRAMQATVPQSTLFPENSSSGIHEHFIENALVEQMARGGGVGVAEALSSTGRPARHAMPSTNRPLPQDIRKRDSWSPGVTMGHDSVRRTGPLAAQLPPQDDSWIDSPQAELHLRDLLKHGNEPRKVTP